MRTTKTNQNDSNSACDRRYFLVIGCLLFLTFIIGSSLVIYRIVTVECNVDLDCNGYQCLDHSCECPETHTYYKCNPSGYYDPVIDGLVWTLVILLFSLLLSILLCYCTDDRKTISDQ